MYGEVKKEGKCTFGKLNTFFSFALIKSFMFYILVNITAWNYLALSSFYDGLVHFIMIIYKRLMSRPLRM